LDPSPEKYILKSSGTAEYLYGDNLVLDFEYIRKCLMKKSAIELKLLDRETVFNETDQSQFALMKICKTLFNK
jgi:hypothetical protein